MKSSNIKIVLLIILASAVILLFFFISINIYLNKYIQKSQIKSNKDILRLKIINKHCGLIYNELLISKKNTSLIFTYSKQANELSNELEKYLWLINNKNLNNFRLFWACKKIFEFKKLEKNINNFINKFEVEFDWLLMQVSQFSNNLFKNKKILSLISEFVETKKFIRINYFKNEINSLYSQLNFIESEHTNFKHKNEEILFINKKIKFLINEINWCDEYEKFLFESLKTEADKLLKEVIPSSKIYILLNNFKKTLENKKTDFKEQHLSKLKDISANLVKNLNEIKLMLYIEKRAKKIVEQINWFEVYKEAKENISLFLYKIKHENINIDKKFIKKIDSDFKVIKNINLYLKENSLSFSDRLLNIKKAFKHINEIKIVLDSFSDE
ncbi:hypothetical protein [Mycoplasma phocimorsus]|uniref:hypothetical protein n=1 Tax=Mycoplasma phocimorsus TaxID=3045839 RepID=UPI0024BF3292|nr:hypothetical protein [Mycoplasma phocimorsus]MDJ1648762.1 hypothetical protein [Mycoplasma phocimorsus]